MAETETAGALMARCASLGSELERLREAVVALGKHAVAVAEREQADAERDPNDDLPVEEARGRNGVRRAIEEALRRARSGADLVELAEMLTLHANVMRLASRASVPEEPTPDA